MSIPSNFLSGPGGTGVRSLLTTETLNLIWSSRPSAQQQQLIKEASIPPPPSNFLSDANITSLARESAWLNLTDAGRQAFLASAPPSTSNNLVSSGGTTNSYRTSGFGSTTTPTAPTTAPLDLANRTAALSQAATTASASAYRSIWKTDADFDSVLRRTTDGADTNSGAIFVTIRAGATGADPATAERYVQNPYIDDPARSDDSYDLFEQQVTNQQNDLVARFGTEQALLGYDINGNGFIDNETELFGFDSASGVGPSFETIFGSYSPATGPLRLDDEGGIGDRLMILRSDGTSVKLDQSSIATSPVGSEFAPYTAVQTVLQTDASGRLEVVAYARQGLEFEAPLPPADVAVTFANSLDAASQTPVGGTTSAYSSIFASASALAAVLNPSTADGGNGSAVFVNVRTGAGAERVTNPYTDDPLDPNDQYSRYETQVTTQTDTLLNQILGGSGVTQALLGLDDGDGVFDGYQELFGFDDPVNGSGPNFAALFGTLDAAGDRVNLGDPGAFGGQLNNLFVLLPDGSWTRLNRSSDVAATPPVVPDPGLDGSTALTVMQRDAANNLEVVVYSRPLGGTVTNIGV